MSILWLIIKVILLIIVSLVLLVVISLIVILIAPIKYVCLYEKYDKDYGHLKINLMRILKAEFILREGVGSSKVSVLGWVVYQKQEENIQRLVQKGTKQAVDSTEKASKKIVREKSPERKPKKSKMARWLPAKNLLFDQRFKVFLRNVFHTLKEIVRWIKPHTFHFTLIIGKDDPGDTGQFIAEMTLLYPWYCGYGNIEGNYEEKGIWGDVFAKGKCNLITLLKIIIIFVLNKETRQYIHLLLKTRKEH
jgi:hypothetical protein